MDSPCHYCDKRTEDCHAKCEDYAAFCRERDRERAERFTRVELEGVFIHRKKRSSRGNLSEARRRAMK